MPNPLAITVVVTLLVLTGVVFDLIPMGIPSQWVFPHNSSGVLPVPEFILGFLLFATIAYVALSARRHGASSRMAVAARIAVIVLLGVLFDWVVLLAGRTGAAENTFALLDEHATGYYEIAVGIDSATDYMRTFHARQKEPKGMFTHADTHPPGRTLFSYALHRIVQSSPRLRAALVATMPLDIRKAFRIIEENRMFPQFEVTDTIRAGILLHIYVFLALLAVGKIIVALSIWRLYDATTSLEMACLYMFVPSPILFFGHYDCFFGAVTASSVALAILAVQRESRLLSFSYGVVAMLHILLSVAFGVPGVWVGLYWLLALPSYESPRAFLSRYVVPGLGGCILVLAVLWVGFGLPLIKVCALCLKYNSEFFADQSVRTAIWRLVNPVEFLVSMGIHAAVVLLAYVWNIRKRLPNILEARNEHPANPVILAAVGMFFLLLFAPTKAEVSRQWSLVWPIFFLVLPKAYLHFRGLTRRLLLVSGALLTLQIFVFRFFVKLVVID